MLTILVFLLFSWMRQKNKSKHLVAIICAQTPPRLMIKMRVVVLFIYLLSPIIDDLFCIVNTSGSR